jgi:hypothetical protein
MGLEQFVFGHPHPVPRAAIFLASTASAAALIAFSLASLASFSALVIASAISSLEAAAMAPSRFTYKKGTTNNREQK